MTAFTTEQESFWAGEFGDAYVVRNVGPEILAAKTAFFAKVFQATGRVASLIEFGANVGLNLRACSLLMPEVQLSAVEINQSAYEELSRLPGLDAHLASLLEFKTEQTWEMSMVMGVLIHMAPERLPDVYQLLYASSSRYILISEYYNPTPVEIPYRGHAKRLFKRDFAGEMLDLFPDLVLRDYGFLYHRDPNFPVDDDTWFLLEKRPSA